MRAIEKKFFIPEISITARASYGQRIQCFKATVPNTMGDSLGYVIRQGNEDLIKHLRHLRFFALYVIGSTETSTIPGISIAGATPQLTLWTPVCDVEYLVRGCPVSCEYLPVTPEGIPSPAVLTRALLQLAKTPYSIADAGSYVEPKVPHYALPSRTVGKAISTGSALPPDTTKSIIKEAEELAEMLAEAVDVFLIGESIPGGTTTALGVLTALGIKSAKVSSAGPQNPIELKKHVVREGLQKSGVKQPASDVVKVISAVGESVQAAVVGLAAAALKLGKKVVLAGGTQMAAAAALLKTYLRRPLSDVVISTTRWLMEDPTSDMEGLVKEVCPEATLVEVKLDFTGSPHEGLSYYERGFVKEGVGAGGTAFLALLKGHELTDLHQAIYDEYGRLRA